MSQENIALVKGSYEAFQRGGTSTASWRCSTRTSNGSYPVLRSFHSPAPAKATRGSGSSSLPWTKRFEIQRFEPKEFLAVDDKVIVLGDDTGRVKATGTVVDTEWAHVMTIRNGKVVRFHEYEDTSALVDALQKESVA